ATLTESETAYGVATLRWTPTANDEGVYTVTVTVTDHGNGDPARALSDSRTFQLIVRAGNAAPVIAPIANQTAAEGQALPPLPLTAGDADGDTLTWSATNLPTGAVLDPATGVLTFTPNFDQARDYPVTVTVTDGSLSDTESFTLVVTNTNRAPQLVPVPAQSARENAELRFRVVGGDPDGGQLELTVSNLPRGARFDPLSGQFRWTPDFTQAGDYTVTFRLEDVAHLFDTTAVQIRVENVDRAPELATSSHQATLGQPLSFAVNGSDPDVGDTLAYSARGLPDGATLNAATGQVSWIPGPAQGGEYVVTFTASDGTLATSRAVVL